MFIDEAEIIVQSGDGGHGCISFRREKYVPKGGPNGGNGGNGGSVYILARDGIDTLLDFVGKHNWAAQRGGDGMGKNMAGKKGDDLIIRVPTGTIVHDLDHELILKDLNTPEQTICVARGGHGGHGNAHFASPTNQAPRHADPGKPGRQRRIKLELKLIADIGLVGLPNAGKSTLLSRISAARPKVASYPFTTLKPQLGIVELPGYRRYVVADIPGLIEGSHKGHGLGHDFLKHIERTRVIVHLVDISAFDGSDPIENYHTIRNELAQHSEILAEKTEIVVATKMDLDPDGEKLDAFKQALDREVLSVSAVTSRRLPELTERMWREAQSARARETTT
jgi:GTP-binding protein